MSEPSLSQRDGGAAPQVRRRAQQRFLEASDKAAYRLVQMPLARVARALGHADTAATYKIYLHFFPDDFTADMDRLDAYLLPSTTTPKARMIRSANLG